MKVTSFLTSQYKKALHAYAQRRYYYKKKYGVDIGPAPSRPKRITEGSIRKIKKSGRPSAKTIKKLKERSIPAPAIAPEEEGAPSYVDIVWSTIMAMLEAAPLAMSSSMPYYNPGASKHTGRRLSEGNAYAIQDILEDAERRLGREEVVRRLTTLFGEGSIRYELERLVYAVYDREYSRWGSGEFASAKARLQTVLA